MTGCEMPPARIRALARGLFGTYRKAKSPERRAMRRHWRTIPPGPERLAVLRTLTLIEQAEKDGAI
jgi:hypothetical protein